MASAYENPDGTPKFGERIELPAGGLSDGSLNLRVEPHQLFILVRAELNDPNGDSSEYTAHLDTNASDFRAIRDLLKEVLRGVKREIRRGNH